jgi:CRISPR-associated endoribonuclease Cas6
LPPLEGERRLAPGETLTFGITLFGKIIELLPYILLVTSALEAAGLGRRLDEHRGQRGAFQIQQIEAYHPIKGTRQVVSQAGKLQAEVPTLSVTAADVKERAAELSMEAITLHFLTPMRLVQNESPVYQLSFQPLIARLLERLALLEQVYGQDEGASPSERWAELTQLAQTITCAEDRTTWENVQSHSRRTRYTSQIGGLLGSATFTGDLAPFRELLVWGELIHAGKNTVKGSGWYRIDH